MDDSEIQEKLEALHERIGALQDDLEDWKRRTRQAITASNKLNANLAEAVVANESRRDELMEQCIILTTEVFQSLNPKRE